MGHMGPGLGTVSGHLRSYLGRVVEQPLRPRPLRVSPCVCPAPRRTESQDRPPAQASLLLGHRGGSWRKTLLVSERAGAGRLGEPARGHLGIHLQDNPSTHLSLCDVDSAREGAG